MINLSFEINEVNSILGALGQMPYAQVKDLVENIQRQAVPQVQQQQQAQEEASS